MDSKEKQLDHLIQLAVKKIGGGKENDICRYIPVPAGGYIHHFTMRKMKSEAPQQLAEMITKHIVNVPNPQEVLPKPRAARGSRKRKELFTLTKQDLEKMLGMARMAGDREMVRKLTPRKDLKAVKRELVSSIRGGRVEPELWDNYVEAMNSQVQISMPSSYGHSHSHGHSHARVAENYATVS